jgi:hypothetical protein
MDLSGLQSRAEGDIVRVYLLADGLLFSTGGGVPFAAEAAFSYSSSETRITIEGLPVGPIYQALVGVGYESGGLWNVDAYSESRLFQLSPNDETVVVMENFVWPSFGISFAPDLRGKSLKGVAPAGGDVYTAEERKVYLLDGSSLALYDQYDLAADPNEFGVSTRRVLGLSDDRFFLASDALLNTDAGVIPFYGGDGWDFQSDFSAGLAGNRAILESGTQFLLPSQDNALFFRRADGLGGVYRPYLLTFLPWVNLDVDGVRDMVLSQYNAYFATAGGAFALPPAFLQDLTPTLAEYRVPFSAPAEILSLGFKPSGAAPGGTLFMGTTDGVWEVAVDESEGISFLGTATQIPETDGERIERIAISESYDLEAYISRYFLFVRKNEIIDKMPFFAVIPGKATGMIWGGPGGDNLFISGSEGLSTILVGS